MHPFNLAGAYVNFMMDDEADGSRSGDVWRQLRAPGARKGEIRSAESVPRESEHRARRRLKPEGRALTDCQARLSRALRRV